MLFRSVLEIGAGSSPHLKYVKHEFGKYFFLENSKFAIDFLKKKFNDKKNFEFKSYNGKKIPFKNNYFDRIIISHVYIVRESCRERIYRKGGDETLKKKIDKKKKI